MSQSLVDTTELRVQTYVGDPCVSLRGTRSRCNNLACVMILFWLVLGWGLSYHKAQLSDTIDWIGYTLHIGANEVAAKIK